MTEEEWLTYVDVEQLLNFLKKGSGRAKLRSVLSRSGCERKQRLFLVACCQRILTHMPDRHSLKGVEVAETYADGWCDQAMLQAAHTSARKVCQRVTASSNYAGYCSACAAAEVSGLDFKQGFDRCVYGADCASIAPAVGRVHSRKGKFNEIARNREKASQCSILRDIFGNPFRPVVFDPRWRSETTVAMAAGIYEGRAFDRLPILADALEDAGCDNTDVLTHCRGPGPHARGCWVVDGVLGKS